MDEELIALRKEIEEERLRLYLEKYSHKDELKQAKKSQKELSEFTNE